MRQFSISIWPTRPQAEYRVETQQLSVHPSEGDSGDKRYQWSVTVVVGTGWAHSDSTAVNEAYGDRRVAFCRGNKRSTDDYFM